MIDVHLYGRNLPWPELALSTLGAEGRHQNEEQSPPFSFDERRSDGASTSSINPVTHGTQSLMERFPRKRPAPAVLRQHSWPA